MGLRKLRMGLRKPKKIVSSVFHGMPPELGK
jgi:hypothetical protein